MPPLSALAGAAEGRQLLEVGRALDDEGDSLMTVALENHFVTHFNVVLLPVLGHAGGADDGPIGPNGFECARSRF